MEAKSENIWGVIIIIEMRNADELLRHAGIGETKPREQRIEKLTITR
jgi:hypothetical protein